MAETLTTLFTTDNASFAAVKKIAIANVVTTKNRVLIPEGEILHKDISIYVVILPIKPKISANLAEEMAYSEKVKNLDLLMRGRAKILENDQVWYAEKINHASVASVFKRIESTNIIAKQGGFTDYDKNGQIIVITEKLV